MNRERTSITLRPETRRILDAWSEQSHTPRSYLIQKAVDRMLADGAFFLSVVTTPSPIGNDSVEESRV